MHICIIYKLLLKLKQNKSPISVYGKPDGYTSLQVGSNVCFYVSTSPIWPYDTQASTDNNAAYNCSKMNLDLAVIKSDAERVALWNMFRNHFLFDFTIFAKKIRRNNC